MIILVWEWLHIVQCLIFFIEAQKQEHVDYCLKMLETFDSGRSIRVHNIITGDESQFYYYDLQMKHYCQVSMASNSPPPAKVLRQWPVGKHMSAIFFMKTDFNTTIPRSNGKTILAKRFLNECFSNGLKKLKKIRRLNGLPILHNNASVSKGARKMSLFGIQRVQLVDHPAYAFDLSPHNLYLFLKSSRTALWQKFPRHLWTSFCCSRANGVSSKRRFLPMLWKVVWKNE